MKPRVTNVFVGLTHDERDVYCRTEAEGWPCGSVSAGVGRRYMKMAGAREGSMSVAAAKCHDRSKRT